MKAAGLEAETAARPSRRMKHDIITDFSRNQSGRADHGYLSGDNDRSEAAGPISRPILSLLKSQHKISGSLEFPFNLQVSGDVFNAPQ